MRTYDEVQKRMKDQFLTLMQRYMKELENGGLADTEATKRTIKAVRSYLENIDEVTAIEIGAQTNSLIEEIRKEYLLNPDYYYQNFEGFIDDIIGLTKDGKPKPGAGHSQEPCLLLGVGINELQLFKGESPIGNKSADLFKQIINANYGTNIPTSSVEQQALQDYEAIPSRDEIPKAQAYVHLSEIRRDAGKLKNGGTYNLLANNKAYQEAKAKCAGRQL